LVCRARHFATSSDLRTLRILVTIGATVNGRRVAVQFLAGSMMKEFYPLSRMSRTTALSTGTFGASD
jgi:hypothetical protein